MKEENKKRRCFYILPSQDSDIYGGYVPSLVTEDEAGHAPLIGDGHPISQPWVWGKTLDEAEAIAATRNFQKGLSEEDVDEIIASSMRAQYSPRQKRLDVWAKEATR